MSGVVKILLVLLLIGGLLGLVLIAISNTDALHRRLSCANNLRQIARAVEDYRETYGTYPIGTIPNPELPPHKRLSWLVAILPFLEQDNLYHAISKDRAWDDQTHDAVNQKIGGGG
jgi:hypothetical protein